MRITNTLWMLLLPLLSSLSHTIDKPLASLLVMNEFIRIRLLDRNFTFLKQLKLLSAERLLRNGCLLDVLFIADHYIQAYLKERERGIVLVFLQTRKRGECSSIKTNWNFFNQNMSNSIINAFLIFLVYSLHTYHNSQKSLSNSHLNQLYLTNYPGKRHLNHGPKLIPNLFTYHLTHRHRVKCE